MRSATRRIKKTVTAFLPAALSKLIAGLILIAALLTFEPMVPPRPQGTLADKAATHATKILWSGFAMFTAGILSLIGVFLAIEPFWNPLFLDTISHKAIGRALLAGLILIPCATLTIIVGAWANAQRTKSTQVVERAGNNANRQFEQNKENRRQDRTKENRC